MAEIECLREKKEGRWMCKAKKCHHWREDGCELGKVSLSCDNTSCKWHAGGSNHCQAMDVHLDADGWCLGVGQ